MKQSRNSLPPRRTFLYWLLAPVMLAWLATNYLLASVGEPNRWSQESVAKAMPPTEIRSGAVTIWFDEAWASQYHLLEPILTGHGMTAVTSVSVSKVGSSSGHINWPQLRMLQKKGWEVAQRPEGRDCREPLPTQREAQADIEYAGHMLLTQGIYADHYVLPCGEADPVIQSEAKDHYLTALGRQTGFNRPDDMHWYDLRIQRVGSDTALSEIAEWISRAGEENLWLVLLFPRLSTDAAVSFSLEDSDREDALGNRFFASVIEMLDQSGLTVVTPSQAVMLLDHQP